MTSNAPNPPAAAPPLAGKAEGPDGLIISDPSISRINADGIKVFKQYRRGEVLGKGGFATCYALQSLDSGTVYAAKVVSKAKVRTASAKKSLIREIKIHRQLDHPHVVKFQRFFETETDVYVLMDRCSNKTVADVLASRKRLSEPEARVIMTQVLSAMTYLHANRIVHRDLKPGNLLLDDHQQVRVCDFGLATEIPKDESRRTTMCGTPNNIAPEVLRHDASGHGFEVDIWAFGTILYALLVGKPPFEQRTVKDTYECIRTNSYHIPRELGLSLTVCALIRWCLAADPRDRPTLEEIQNDDFFRHVAAAPSNVPALTACGASDTIASDTDVSSLTCGLEGATLDTTVVRNPLQHFSSHLRPNLPASAAALTAGGVRVVSEAPWTYVRKCTRTGNGHLFRMSDGTTQLCFENGKECFFAIAGTAIRAQT
jgi:serine/threonine protein kinase